MNRKPKIKGNEAASADVIKAVAYARVSSKEQEKEGFSIPAQQKLLRGYAEANRLKIVQDYVDIETAKQTGRTNFEEMVRFLRRRDDIHIVLVEKTDRLYRNLKDWVTMDELEIEIHIVKEGVVLSRDSKSSEKFVHGIKVLMAKNYIDNLSEEARKGQQEKAEQGIWPTKAPLGYLNITGANGKKIIELDPDSAPIIIGLFEWYATGTISLKEAAERARSAGLVHRRNGTPVPVSSVHKILSTRLYTGEFDWNGNRYKGIHRPLVTRDLWERVQNMLAERNARKVQSPRDFAFSGLIRCGHCNCAMVGELKKKRYVYYHCSGYKGKCPERYVRQEVIVEKFAAALDRLAFDDEVQAWVTKALRESHADEQKEHEAAVARLQAEHDRLQQRLQAMYIDKLDGRIDHSFYTQMSEQWRLEQDNLMVEIIRHREADRSYIDEGVRLIDLAKSASRLFRMQQPSEQRRLLNFVLSNSTWQNGELHPTFRQPFDLIARATAETTQEKDGKRRIPSEHPDWLRFLYTFRTLYVDTPAEIRVTFEMLRNSRESA
jgi:site-specific DNA recombinase